MAERGRELKGGENEGKERWAARFWGCLGFRRRDAPKCSSSVRAHLAIAHVRKAHTKLYVRVHLVSWQLLCSGFLLGPRRLFNPTSLQQAEMEFRAL